VTFLQPILFWSSFSVRTVVESLYHWTHSMRCEVSRPFAMDLMVEAISACKRFRKHDTVMACWMQLVIARLCLSNLQQVQLQALWPDILIPEQNGGLSHCSSLVEMVPIYGGEEWTTAMMLAFIPTTMKSLLEVCLDLSCAVMLRLPCSGACYGAPCHNSNLSAHNHCLQVPMVTTMIIYRRSS